MCLLKMLPDNHESQRLVFFQKMKFLATFLTALLVVCTVLENNLTAWYVTLQTKFFAVPLSCVKAVIMVGEDNNSVRNRRSAYSTAEEKDKVSRRLEGNRESFSKSSNGEIFQY